MNKSLFLTVKDFATIIITLSLSASITEQANGMEKQVQQDQYRHFFCSVRNAFTLSFTQEPCSNDFGPLTEQEYKDYKSYRDGTAPLVLSRYCFDPAQEQKKLLQAATLQLAHLRENWLKFFLKKFTEGKTKNFPPDLKEMKKKVLQQIQQPDRQTIKDIEGEIILQHRLFDVLKRSAIISKTIPERNYYHGTQPAPSTYACFEALAAHVLAHSMYTAASTTFLPIIETLQKIEEDFAKERNKLLEAQKLVAERDAKIRELEKQLQTAQAAIKKENC